MPAPNYVARSLTELIDIRAREQADLPAVHTGAQEFGEAVKTLTYSQIQIAVDRLADHYASLDILPTPFASSSSLPQLPPERVIAVLISTAIDESLLEIALAKLGLSSLLLSVNNSTAAVAHLIKQTKASHLIYGPKFAETAREAQHLLREDGLKVEILPETRYPLWGPEGVDGPEEQVRKRIRKAQARLSPDQESSRTCVILHSSGSTGFPKPVFISHYGLIANIEKALPKPGFSALPLFHGFGHFSIFRCFYYGQPFTLFPPHLPMTSRNIVAFMKKSPSPPKQHFAVPYVLKLLAETSEGVASLASMEAVSFAGAAVPDDLGDRLVAAGVNLISTYGTTETGTLLNSRRDYVSDKAWNWLRAEGPIVDYLQMEQRSSDTYELVVRDGWPPKIMSNRPDNSYATKDLFLQHPDHPSWFKYVGRLDDTLTQTLGEKTNPVPIENAIRGNSPFVQECIVFGDGRPQIGCLIRPSERARDVWQDRVKYMDVIWPTIEAANAKAPTHSRILPEMVEILDITTEIPVATKMSILRPACYKQFAPIIDAIYDRFENGAGLTKLDIRDLDEMQNFITRTVQEAVGPKAHDISPSTDLFALGVDSLQATRIRNVITKSLNLNGASLGQNIVYENPSVESLAQHILRVKAGESCAKSAEQQHATMLHLVEKWAEQLTSPNMKQQRSRGHGHVVLLTGATGSLGAHLLDQFARNCHVIKIICLSRAKDHAESLERVKQSLAIRGRALDDAAWSKIVSLAADVNRHRLGLTEEEFEHLRSSTIVVHNAWPVNFVLSIESYDEHIGGAVNLLNLATSSGASFYFSSSVATRQGRPDPIVYETYPDKPVTAAPMGYGRSKWVVEKLCERAAQMGTDVGVYRIGQLVGDNEKGIWNETEAWPLMFKSANVVGCLPALDEKVSWLPVNLAAKSMVEIATAEAASDTQVHHIVNSNVTASWDVVLEGLKEGGLEFKTVDRRTWLQELAKSDSDVEKNPTYKLLNFYQGRFGSDAERPYQEMSTQETRKIAPTIGQCPAVSQDLVALWVRHWRETGFLSAAR